MKWKHIENDNKIIWNLKQINWKLKQLLKTICKWILEKKWDSINWNEKMMNCWWHIKNEMKREMRNQIKNDKNIYNELTIRWEQIVNEL